MRNVSTGSVNQSIVFHAFDADGAPVTLAHNAPGLSISYAIDVDGREGTPVALTPIARAVTGAHEDGAITSKGDGKHEVDLPDAAAATAGYVRLIVSATAVTGRVYSEVIAVGVLAELDTATLALINNIPTNSELATALSAADDAVLAAISALNNLSAAQVNAELLDVLSVDTFAELSAPPSASSSLKDKLVYLFMWARNKATQTATERKLYADDGTTVVSTEAVSDVSGTFTKGEAS